MAPAHAAPARPDRPARTRPSIVLVVAVALLTTGCATPRTQMGRIDPAALRAEEANQQQYALQSRLKQQARLQSVGFPLLQSAVPLCGRDVARRMGMLYANAPSFAKDWRDAARAAGFTDTVSVTQVLAGSGAERAGLKPGDRLLTIDGTQVSAGGAAVRDLNAWLARREKTEPAEYRVTYRRGDSTFTAVVPTELVCSYRLVLLPADELNAFADGQNVYVTTAMLRFASDDAELATVVGHEIAHDAMHHMDAQKRNATIGAILGAVVDVAAAANGVNTQGEYTKDFAQLGAMVFSQDFEREADYVGMYVVARSGRSVHDAADLWRHMAAENPGSIRFASSHPTTAERFLRLRQFAGEIESKQAAGLALVPEFKQRPGAPLENPGGQVLAAAGKRVAGSTAATAPAAAIAPAPASQSSPTTESIAPRSAPPPADVAASLRSASAPQPVAPQADAPAPTALSGPRAAGDASAGAVPVHVTVRVPDWIVGRFRYVPNYPVLVVGPAHDSTVVRTDSSGSATFRLRPGHYRVAPYRGDRVAARTLYEWDVEFDVGDGMTSVDLSESNGHRRGR